MFILHLQKSTIKTIPKMSDVGHLVILFDFFFLGLLLAGGWCVEDTSHGEPGRGADRYTDHQREYKQRCLGARHDKIFPNLISWRITKVIELIKAWRVSMFLVDAEKCSWEKKCDESCGLYLVGLLPRTGFLQCLKVLTLWYARYFWRCSCFSMFFYVQGLNS